MGKRAIELLLWALAAVTITAVVFGLATQTTLDPRYWKAGAFGRGPAELSGCEVGVGRKRSAHHLYVLVHSRSAAAAQQAREVWEVLRPHLEHHRADAMHSVSPAPLAEPIMAAELALCPGKINKAVQIHLFSAASAGRGTVSCHLHLILVLPKVADLVYALYQESNGLLPEPKYGDGQHQGSKQAPMSLHGWSNAALGAVPERCFGNRTEGPGCCSRSESTTQPLSPLVQAGLPIQAERWRQHAANRSSTSGSCKISVTEIMPGIDLDLGRNSYPMQQLACLFHSSNQPDPGASAGVVLSAVRKVVLRPVRTRPREQWDLQTLSKVTTFLEKHGKGQVSVRSSLDELSLQHDEWVKRLKRSAYNCSSPQGVVVVVFCESAYVRVLLNWMVFYTALRHTNKQLPPALIVSQSRELQEFIQQYYPCSVYLSPSPSLNMAAAFWKTRLRVFLWLSRWNFTVVHSDVDAVWAKDPVPALMERLHGEAKARFVFSQDIYPGEQLEKWGATACMGFFACRGGPRTGRLWLRAMQKFVSMKDDQRAVNSVLDDNGSLHFDKDKVTRSASSPALMAWPCASSNRRKIAVCLLPQNLVLRECSRSHLRATAHVFHCHSSKQGSSKEASLRQMRLWRLQADNVQPSNLLADSSKLLEEAEQIFQ